METENAFVKFDRVCTHVLKVAGKLDVGNLDETTAELFRLAWELDGLRGRIQVGAETMAERFARYEKELSSGRLPIGEPPTGWSTLRDLERDSATYNACYVSFQALFRVVSGGVPYANALSSYRAEKAAEVKS